MLFSCLDDYSANPDTMRTTVNPLTSAGELSAPTTGQGEIERIRFVLERVLGLGYWYKHNDNVNFTHGTFIQGSGLGRHVTAVGYHSWTGFLQGAPRPAQFPAITSVLDHWTGLAFPAVSHVSVVIGDNNVGGGVKGGVEMLRMHAYGVTMHHSAALRFAHSTFQMDGGQRGHVTVLQLNQGLPGQGEASDDNSKNDAAYKDSIVIGHATVGIMIHGTGITGGANRLYGLSADGRYMETKQISGSGITISHQTGQISFGVTASAGALPTFTLRPESAVLSGHNDTNFGIPELVKHTLANNVSWSLMFHDGALSGTQVGNQTAHWYVGLPDGTSYTGASITIISRQPTRITGEVGWHVYSRLVSHNGAWQGAPTTNTVYPVNVNGTAGSVIVQTEHMTTSGLSTATGNQTLQIGITRLIQPGANVRLSTAERTAFIMAIIRMR